MHAIENQYNAEKLIANQNNNEQNNRLKWEKLIDRNGNNKLA